MTHLLNDLNLVIITDDTQNLYGATGFWLEVLKNDPRRVISFASYRLHSGYIGHPATPAEFTERISIEYLLYTSAELDELMTNLKASNSIPSTLFSDKVRDEMLTYSGGYPLMITNFLNKIEVKKNEGYLGDICTDFFGNNSRKFLEIASSEGRCFKDICQIEDFCQQSLKDGEQKIKDIIRLCLYHLIHYNQVNLDHFSKYSTYSTDDFKRCLDHLVIMCIVQKVKLGEKSEYYSFFNEIFCAYYTRQFFNHYQRRGLYKRPFDDAKKKELLTKSTPDHKVELVKLLISQFDSDQLSNTLSLSKVDALPLEPIFDRMVYMAFYIIGIDSISPQYSDKTTGNLFLFCYLLPKT